MLRDAVIDTDVILGHSRKEMNGNPVYLEMLERCNWFYGQPTYQEVYKYEVYRANSKKETLSPEELTERTDKRLADYTRLDTNTISIHKASQITERLSRSCLSTERLTKMEKDITICSISMAYLYDGQNLPLCISNNNDFLFIECSSPKNLEVWSDRDPEKIKPPCSKLKLSMEESGVFLGELE